MSQPPPRPPPAVLNGNSNFRYNPLTSQYGYSSVMQSPYMGISYGMQDPYVF